MNILMFGPNGSGKGTQGALLHDKYGIPHIEAGVIFRNNIKEGTELGKKARIYIDKGELVPDELTVPMVLNRLQQTDCLQGWILDGFPRNLTQAEALQKNLVERVMKLDYVVEIVLDRDISKKRIMGRRLCPR
ncbi:MAG: nucleoside monophosphate kinase, partial [Deltaproteobacteria bacterium]|nr:nucleoside monophosphate kinase [Deltaproteobacteria bacterium]